MLRREGGYAQIFFADGGTGVESPATLSGAGKVLVSGSVYECSTYTCFHCKGVVHVPPGADVNFVGFCRHCMQAICGPCSSKPCSPYERRVLEIGRKTDADREYSELLGW